MQFEIGRTSRLGNREVNQDRLTVIEDRHGAVLVLGDGLGGKPGGDLAAQTLVDTIKEALHRRNRQPAVPWGIRSDAVHDR